MPGKVPSPLCLTSSWRMSPLGWTHSASVEGVVKLWHHPDWEVERDSCFNLSCLKQKRRGVGFDTGFFATFFPSVYLSACLQDISKSYEWIYVKLCGKLAHEAHREKKNWLTFHTSRPKGGHVGVHGFFARNFWTVTHNTKELCGKVYQGAKRNWLTFHGNWSKGGLTVGMASHKKACNSMNRFT